MNLHKSLLSVLFLITVLSGCNKNKDEATVTDITESGQQVGDVMASIDESGGNATGSISVHELESARRTFARWGATDQEFSLAQWLIPESHAASCSSAVFSSCSSGSRTKSLSSCTIGSATFSGSIDLTFSDNSCSMAANGATVTRVPNFTVTGRRGGTLTVEKTGTYGQRITKGTSSLTFENDGIRRSFNISGQTLFDFTTTTTSPVTITGTSRSGRTLSGGSLRITNNSTSASCTISPSNVTYTSTCNCATSGTWSGTCSDGSSFSMELSGCGSASLTIGSESQSVTFDRCYSN